MKLNELKYVKGSRHSCKRLGRGVGSGLGKTSGRGMKGQKARTGGGIRLGFEGGQTPIFRRIPKMGFVNTNFNRYIVFNLSDLERLNIRNINHNTLLEENIIKSKKVLIKILGKGKITKVFNVKVNKISESAKKAIEKVGGKVEVMNINYG